jgi:hypothetical protein
LLAHVLEDEIELTRSVLLYPRRDANSAWLGQTFKANRDVHAVTKDVAVLDYNVAHIDANPEVDAPAGRYVCIPHGHLSLYLGGAAQSVDYAAELDEKPVTRSLDEPAVMRSDRRVE